MKKTYASLLTSLLITSALSVCAQDIQAPVEIPAIEKVQYDLASFCGTKHYNISQDVTISDVAALAQHRNGKLMIIQEVGHSEINNALLQFAKSQDVYPACMEYLSDSGLMRVTSGEQLLARVYFDSGSEKLSRKSRDILVKIAKKLVNHPDIIRIQGNADSNGSVSYNYSLGLRRAIITKDFLDKQGVDTEKLKSESQGEAKPLVSNDTAEGRGVNRRVDLLGKHP